VRSGVSPGEFVLEALDPGREYHWSSVWNEFVAGDPSLDFIRGFCDGALAVFAEIEKQI
jgi:hypothetical protein